MNKINDRLNINDNDNRYRKELIMAKIIISELQDNISILNEEKKELEYKLEKSLNSLKDIHSNYISLTQKFDTVNQIFLDDKNNKEKKYEKIINELNIKNSELISELNTKKDIYKIQEESFEKKISLLEKKLEKKEEEFIQIKKAMMFNENFEKNKIKINTENIELKEDNTKIHKKFNEEINKMNKEIKEYKNKIKKLENDNFMIKRELNEKKEQENKINNDNYLMDKYNINKNNKYRMHINEKDEEYEIIKEENKYIINLILKITPNSKLIKQIIELNKEIIKLERKKILLMKNDDNEMNNIIQKINNHIDKFKNKLNSLEDELINVDFGSSCSNKS